MRTLIVRLTKCCYADRAAFCWRSYCSRSISSHLLHDMFCDAAKVAEPVIDRRRQDPNSNRPFAAVCLNNRDAGLFKLVQSQLMPVNRPDALAAT
ncbi:hypothetical protein SAMN05444000_1372 [Shimia gijangensis]|uniref:Uncharacterized protein n=1 Tax=Shimia gijangensis TaxID=1470563 RepID=A0A1M6T9F3_9RHOB|nr:hypothetical protein SAMN05444000_1372 [Shimia gijangensis]